jgi:hypothetical protein
MLQYTVCYNLRTIHEKYDNNISSTFAASKKMVDKRIDIVGMGPSQIVHNISRIQISWLGILWATQISLYLRPKAKI